MQAPANKSLENKPYLPRPALTESARTKPKHTESKGPCAPRARAHLVGSAEGKEGRLPNPAMRHDAATTGSFTTKILSFSITAMAAASASAPPLRLPVPHPPPALETRRETSQCSLLRSVDVGPSCLVPRDFHAQPVYDRDPVGHDPFCWAEARTDGRSP